MSTDDYQELTSVSTKEWFVLEFWRKQLIAVYKEKGEVSAGEFAKAIGQSRTTAKKYLDKLVRVKCAGYVERPHINGIVARYYAPVKIVRQGG